HLLRQRLDAVLQRVQPLLGRRQLRAQLLQLVAHGVQLVVGQRRRRQQQEEERAHYFCRSAPSSAASASRSASPSLPRNFGIWFLPSKKRGSDGSFTKSWIQILAARPPRLGGPSAPLLPSFSWH